MLPSNGQNKNASKRRLEIPLPQGSRKRGLKQFKEENHELRSPKEANKKVKAPNASVQVKPKQKLQFPVSSLQLPNIKDGFKAPLPRFQKLPKQQTVTEEEKKTEADKVKVQKTVFRLSAMDGGDEEQQTEEKARDLKTRRSQSQVISSLRRPELPTESFFKKESREKTQVRNKRVSLSSLDNIIENSEPSSELSVVSMHPTVSFKENYQQGLDDQDLSTMLVEMNELHKKENFSLEEEFKIENLLKPERGAFVGKSPMQAEQDLLDQAFDKDLDEEPEPSASFLEQEALQEKLAEQEEASSSIKEQSEPLSRQQSELKSCLQILDQQVEASVENSALNKGFVETEEESAEPTENFRVALSKELQELAQEEETPLKMPESKQRLLRQSMNTTDCSAQSKASLWK